MSLVVQSAALSFGVEGNVFLNHLISRSELARLTLVSALVQDCLRHVCILVDNLLFDLIVCVRAIRV